MQEASPYLISRSSPAAHSAAFQYRDNWGRLLFGASWMILIAILLFWGGVSLYQNRLEAKKTEWQGQIEATKDELKKKNIDRIFTLSSQLSRTKQLLGDHVLSSKAFAFLSQTTHPRVRFTSLKFSSGARQLELSGAAPSFQTVSEQIGIFEGNRQAVEKVGFGGLALGDKGLVNFQLTIVFTPGFFREKP